VVIFPPTTRMKLKLQATCWRRDALSPVTGRSESVKTRLQPTTRYVQMKPPPRAWHGGMRYDEHRVIRSSREQMRDIVVNISCRRVATEDDDISAQLSGGIDDHPHLVIVRPGAGGRGRA